MAVAFKPILLWLVQHKRPPIHNNLRPHKLSYGPCYIKSPKKQILAFGFCNYIFKYLNFSISVVNSLTDMDISPVEIFAPMGISFVSFTALSYIIDVYRGTAPAVKNILDFYLYLSFFPKAAQGPITAYSQMGDSIASRRCSMDDFSAGLRRFVAGFAKKCLIADVLGKSVDAVFGDITNGINTPSAWLAILFYTLQIYYDFSGYTDMAIGIGKMLGFTLPENFDMPYLSKSVSEFWRRWHMTLGTWFKNYIYFPLGGNRRGMVRTVFNLAVVWFVTGIWHGASYNYILWGVYYGLLVIAEKFICKTKWYAKIPTILKWFATILAVIFGWVLFRCADFPEIITFVKAMFGVTSGAIYSTSYYFDLPAAISFIAGIILTLPRPQIPEIKENNNVFYLAKTVLTVILFVVSAVYMINSTYSSFIYFQF